MKTRLILIALASLLAAPAARAAVTPSFSTFEDAKVPYGSYVTVGSVDGWIGGLHGIELQNHVAGNPASTGGNIFVELDSTANSSMSRLIGAGSYYLEYLYSPRPGISAASDGIDVLINGSRFDYASITAAGGAQTAWRKVGGYFTVSTPSLLTFEAVGTSDSFGGYIDNISVSAAPEASTWLMMMAGLGCMGLALRARAGTLNARPRRRIEA